MTSRIEYHGRNFGRGWRAVCGALALGAMLLSGGIPARAQEAPNYTVLHTFTGADGEYPQANVIRDQAGNLYGTAFNGGDLSGCGGSGCGVVFKVDKSGNETVLYSFMGGADGAFPAMGLLRDQAGNLYSTTHGGGDTSSCSPTYGCGVVFRIALLDGGDPDISQEYSAAERDETTERPRVVLPENFRELLQQRRGFGRFGARLVGPR